MRRLARGAGGFADQVLPVAQNPFHRNDPGALCLTLEKLAMKKSLIALAALAAVGAASAQSSVTLYGVIDTNYGWARTTVKNLGGVSGTDKTTTTGLNAAGGNMSGSRWGLKGQEDLGNGLSAVFNVEAGFNSGDGRFAHPYIDTYGDAIGSGFNRRAVVGLKGGFGQVLLGRDYTPLDDLLGGNGYQAIDLSTYNVSPDGTALYTGRADGIHYSGNFSGVGVKAFVSYERVKVASDSGTDSDDRAEGYGLNLSYATGPFAIAGGAQQFKTKDIIGVTGKNTEYAVAASYDFTAAKVFGHYAGNDLDAGQPTMHQYSLGVAVPFGAATLGAQYAYNKQGDFKGHDVVLQGTYALSKRTDLYARAGRYNSWKFKAADASTKSDVVAVGVRHRF